MILLFKTKSREKVIAFNKIAKDNETVMGFNITISERYKPDKKERIDCSIDFTSNDEIDWLISMLNKLKEV